MNIQAAHEAFIQKMQSKNWSEKTIKNYGCQVLKFLEQFKEIPRAKEVNANDIEMYLLAKVNINSRNHSCIKTTLRYTHVSTNTISRTPSPIQLLI